MHFIQFISTTVLNSKKVETDTISYKNGYQEDFSGFRLRSFLLGLFFLSLVGLYVGLESLDFDEKQASFPISEVEVALLNSNRVLKLPNEIILKDNVTCTDLKEGKTYKLTGKLVEKGTEKPILYENNPITSEKYFKAKGSIEKIEMKYNVVKEALTKNVSTETWLEEVK